jgi:hypothetical protein
MPHAEEPACYLAVLDDSPTWVERGEMAAG